MDKIVKFFDKLEDKTRAKLSRAPVLYAFVGGVGVILFWRGVWHIADEVSLSAELSIIIGGTILLISGAFVSTFIGSRLIISGLSGEKKLAELTKEEIETEETRMKKLQKSVNQVEEKLEKIESEIRLHHPEK